MRKSVPKADVDQELLPGASKALLQELHLLTREGDLNADARRKLKQINHLVGLLRPAIEDALARHPSPVIVDCAAGKSYLGLLLYQLIIGPAGRGKVVSIESRQPLAEAAADRAKRFGMDRFESVAGDVATAALPDRVHVVTALHACDTATDDALLLAMIHHADHVAVVPCCQAEAAAQLKAHKPENAAMAALCDHPWHRREFGSHVTNVMRALALQARGYAVTVTELAGWEHSLKNELILGKRMKRFDNAAERQLETLVAQTGVKVKVVRDLPAAEPPPTKPEHAATP